MSIFPSLTVDSPRRSDGSSSLSLLTPTLALASVVTATVSIKWLWDRVRWIRTIEEIPGPAIHCRKLVTEDLSSHWFLGNIAPILYSIGTLEKYPQYPNAFWWYLNLGDTFANEGLCRVWAFHPYFTPFAKVAIMVFDPFMSKQLLEDRMNSSKLIKEENMYRLASPLVGDSLLALPDGTEWKHQRKMAAASFTPQMLELVCNKSIEILETEVFPQWDQASVKRGNSNQTGVPVEAAMLSSRLALEILGHVAFGYAFGGLKTERASDQEQSLYDGYMEMLGIVLSRSFSVLNLWKLRRKQNAVFHKLSKRLDDVITHVVQRRLDEEMVLEQEDLSNEENAPRKTRDLLDYLVQKDDDGNRMDFRYIFGNVRMFFFAGHDTTANTLANALWHLSTHPDKQKRLQEEVDSLYANLDPSKRPMVKQLNKLKYLDAVTRESLRLHSSGAVGRTTTAPIDLRGRNNRTYHIPAQTQVFVMPVMSHMCGGYWDNAKEFQPERFLDGNKTRMDVWYPFSVGVRNCVGQPMAMTELKCLLAHILHNFLVRPQDGVDSISHTLLLTVKPVEVPIVVQRRRHSLQ